MRDEQSDRRRVVFQLFGIAIGQTCEPPRAHAHRRDTAGYVGYKLKLQKHGVSLLSITQDFGVGPSADFAETVIAASDAFNSAENAKHVSRTMLENARQGFWNGSRPPFGYRAVEAERRGQHIKKRLEIVEQEAAIVRLIYRLCLEGDGTRGPMGIKEIASWLNRRGIHHRGEHPFYTSVVHTILTRETYAGTHYYNRTDSRGGKQRPKEEWVPVAVPAIMEVSDFRRVQDQLKSRRPDVTAPRIVTSEVLLTGLARCESCGGPMMLRTGTGNGGTTYRYYACAGSSLKGKSACRKPTTIREGHLDGLVISALADQLLTPERLITLLNQAIRHRKAMASDHGAQRTSLRKELRTIDAQIDRLVTAVAEGSVPDMPQLRRKLEDLNARREEGQRLLSTLDAQLPEFRQALSKQQAASIAERLKHKLQAAPRALQKRYVHGLVSKIVVSREKAVVSGPPQALAAAASDPERLSGVRGFVREWWARQDSNLGQHRYER